MAKKYDWGDGKGAIRSRPKYDRSTPRGPNGLYDWGDGKGFVHSRPKLVRSTAKVQPAVSQPAPPPEFKPGATPAPAPAINPFKNPDDMFAEADFEANLRGNVLQAEQQLGELKARQPFEAEQVDDTARRSASATVESMIGRGLFRSSVKDAHVYDIEAQRAMQQTFLNDRVRMAETAFAALQTEQEKQRAAFYAAQQLKMVQNAQDIEPVIAATPQQDPAPAPAATPQPAAPKIQPPKPNSSPAKAKQPAKTGHVWDDGKQHSRPQYDRSTPQRNGLYDWGDGKGFVHSRPKYKR